MSRYYKQIRHGTDAKRLLNERLAREEMGDEAYDKQASFSGDRTFRRVGLALIILFGLAVLAIAMLGY